MKKSKFIEEKIKDYILSKFGSSRLSHKDCSYCLKRKDLEDLLRQALEEQEANFEAFYAVKELRFKKALNKQKEEFIKMIKKIKKESVYQEYGWSDLEEDLDNVLAKLGKEENDF